MPMSEPKAFRRETQLSGTEAREVHIKARDTEGGDGAERAVRLHPARECFCFSRVSRWLINSAGQVLLNLPLSGAATDKIYHRDTHLHLMEGARSRKKQTTQYSAIVLSDENTQNIP